MSIQKHGDRAEHVGPPGLSPLGKCIEVLRIERGLSKQKLARLAGTSRQQLWRVVTGKSELTEGLCLRLAEALRVDPRELARGVVTPTAEPAASPGTGPTPASLAEYLTDPRHLERTLATLPKGSDGVIAKRAFLNALEDAALASGMRLPATLFDVRHRVLVGDG